MSSSSVELDFFQMEEKKLFDRSMSFRDIQSEISKMNSELLKSTMACLELNSNEGKPTRNGDTFRGNTSCLESTTGTTPLTIFYNGTVAVFDLPQQRAENIFKLAVSSNERSQLQDTRNGDHLPLARRKSLQRFLEKRKQRLNLTSRYGCPTDYTACPGRKSLAYCRL
ncbi:hypothetical protein Vadar_033019 [Vaccinium darrowii]|uniref:Uncharacterized protein n=1 Tax=Vaccinium darrowii TaxID=229202 RepID=A0ACB7X603_9ERIC|nr:hypothetical protein Vadar_033019 [Vaccinium darrowii]